MIIENWDKLLEHLTHIGMYLDDQTVAKIKLGDMTDIVNLFRRIERFLVKITYDPKILDFSEYRRELEHDKKSLLMEYRKSTNNSRLEIDSQPSVALRL